MAKPAPLSPVDAFEAIQRILEARDALSFTRHALGRGRTRRFTIDDVRRVLTRGTVSPDAEWDATYNNWVYKVSGVDYDNEPLTVVIALEPAHSRITIITAHD